MTSRKVLLEEERLNIVTTKNAEIGGQNPLYDCCRLILVCRVL